MLIRQLWDKIRSYCSWWL